MDLQDALKEVQGERTQTEFAKELGISPATLSNIYSGRRGIGKQVISALLQHPDTRDLTLSFLSQNIAFEKGFSRLSNACQSTKEQG